MNESTRLRNADWMQSHVTAISAAVVAALGVLVLFGWAFNIAILKSALPGLDAMKANTALCVVLAGAGLWLLRHEQTPVWQRRTALICATVVSVIAVATLIEYLSGWNFGIDQLLFRDPALQVAGPLPGRMAPTTAVAFTFLSIALVLLNTPRRVLVAQIVTLPVLVLSIFVVTGYLYQAESFVHVFTFGTVALHTGVALLLMAVGILLARPRAGFMALFYGDGPGALIARRLLPVTVFIPLLIGWLRLQGLRTGLVDPGLGAALSAVGSVIVFTFFIMWAAYQLERTGALAVRAESALRGSEDRFRTVVEAMPGVVIVSDMKGEIVMANHRVLAIFGYPLEELIGRSIELLVPQAVRGQHEKLRASYFGGPVARMMGVGRELVCLRKDGTTIPVEIGLDRIEINGEPHSVAFVTDITERKQADTALRDSKERLQSTLDNMLEGAQIVSPDWTYLYVNGAAAAQGRRTPEELLGRTMMEMYPGIDQTPFFATLRRCMDLRVSEHLLNEFDFPDGGKGWFDLSIQPVPEGVFILSSDITERKQAEAALLAMNEELENRVAERTSQLAESEEKFFKAFWSSPAAVSISALADGRWIDVNEALTKMIGYSQDEIIGRTSAELGLVDSSARAKILQAIQEHGRVRDVEIKVRTKSNQILDVLVSTEQTVLGGVPCVLTIQYDITKRKQAEAEIQRLNDDLQQRQKLLENANKELEGFSYSVSHDLRAPLRAIDGFSRILQEEHTGQLDAGGLRYLGLVRDNAQKMGRLIDDLLAFSRLGRQALKTQTVDLAELARLVVGEHEADLNGRKVDVVIGDLPPCNGDPALLRQVMVNFVANALKFTRQCEAARIEVGSLHKDGSPVYFVKDNGAGFDMQYVDKLFGVFQRLHRAEDFEGTGVGLAIVQRIIARHGGQVWAEGEVGKGATFYFTLGDNAHGD